MKRLVRRDDMLEAGDVSAEMGRSAGRDENVARADALAGREQAHGVGVLEHRPGLDDRYLRALQVRGVGELEARDLAVLVGDQLPPVEGRLADAPAVAG